MTKNQNDYHRNQEEKRHNLAMEELTRMQNAETNRANLAKEGENLRSNVARETENTRSNMASESNVRSQIAMNDRHFLRQDAETKRHDEYTEWQGDEQRLMNNRQKMEDQAIARLNQQETVRHNQAEEGIQVGSTVTNLFGTLGSRLGSAWIMKGAKK